MTILVEIRAYLLTWETILALAYITVVALLLASFIFLEFDEYEEDDE